MGRLWTGRAEEGYNDHETSLRGDILPAYFANRFSCLKSLNGEAISSFSTLMKETLLNLVISMFVKAVMSLNSGLYLM